MSFKLVLSFLVLLVFVESLAQDIPKFGKIPDEYVEMKVFPKDSSAEAVILFDQGNIGFEYIQNSGWALVFDRHIAIKILSKDGYEWANQEVKLYSESNSREEVISQIKGYTYNEQNDKIKVSKLSNSSIFTEETNEYWNTEKFTMPDVKVGSVIEFKYTIRSDFYFNLRSWDFQYEIPVMYSELTTNIPEYFKYRLITQGYYDFFRNEEDQSNARIKLTSSQRNGNLVSRTTFQTNEIDYIVYKHLLATKDIPAMKKEAYTSTINNYRMHIDFELQYTKFPGSEYKDYRGSWATLNKQFVENEYFGKTINRIGSIKEELKPFAALSSDNEKIAAVYDLIRSKISWNGFYSKYATSTLNKSFKDGEGNIADINLALTGALRDVGLEAYAVLLSTRSNGLVRKNFPLSRQFNYVVSLVKIGDKKILLDASTGLPPGYLPTKCLNGEGWMVSESGGGWVNLSENTDYKIQHTVTLEVNNSSEIEANVRSEKVMYASFKERSDILNNGEESRVESIEESYNWDIKSYEILNLKNSEEPLTEQYTLTSSNEVDKLGNLLLIKPIIIGAQSENPFKLKNRQYPVDFTYPRYYAYQGTIKIPEGFAVDQLPASLALSLPSRKGRFIYSIVEKDETVTITSLIQLKESLFLPSEYPFIKEFFSQIVEKHDEKIVFKEI